ncbi:hypothetical protein LNV09_16295 [Paucibacter sp. B2R-40]|uniref:hypothetical protein n=1 Tax=Paucibacter sp. B2R-40 TaxID=2893554 RepID=UPI0021E359C8|nr:hypothetical protein [Paucibacter sp. B2R-40]MCV2355706.1 hypothetical protein [Paucibacter sp. B2R-40]
MSEITASKKPHKRGRYTRGSLGKVHAILIWLPPFAIALAAIFAWHFVSFAFTSNPALNGLILAVMVWGAITMAGHVRRTYQEDRVFFSGIEWLRNGAWSSEPDPHLGPDAFVLGMLGRLDKLGLGHQVYVQSAAMEPELEALEHFFEQKQELSQFLVGLMVGLGLLGTFIGLLETLIATSELIGTIANSVGGAAAGGGSSGGMEAEFAHIVGGLQKPLSAMGTAFSASMFGLIGSIMLGFQMVVVRKTVATFVDNAREEVLSLAEKTKVNANVEITERFLATLLADMLEQHRQSEQRLGEVVKQLAELTPAVVEAARSSVQLAGAVAGQHEALDRTTVAVGQVRDVVPLISQLANASSQTLKDGAVTRDSVDVIAQHLPDQVAMREELRAALQAMKELVREVGEARNSTRDLTTEVRLQGSVVKRLEGVLWNFEKSSLRKMLDADRDPG